MRLAVRVASDLGERRSVWVGDLLQPLQGIVGHPGELGAADLTPAGGQSACRREIRSSQKPASGKQLNHSGYGEPKRNQSNEHSANSDRPHREWCLATR